MSEESVKDEATRLFEEEANKMSKSKMYILIRNDIDLGHQVLASAHASLAGYLDFVKFEENQWLSRDHDRACGRMTDTEKWASLSFRKVVCSVDDKQFQKAKTYGKPGEDYRVMVECGLGGMEVAIVFRPRVDWELFFKSLTLFGKVKKPELSKEEKKFQEYDKLNQEEKVAKSQEWLDSLVPVEVEQLVYIVAPDGESLEKVFKIKVPAKLDKKTGETYLDGHALRMLDEAQCKYRGWPVAVLDKMIEDSKKNK
jgi:peptidyl-tRNA hydrolase